MDFQTILLIIIPILAVIDWIILVIDIKFSRKTYSEGVKKGMDIMENDVLEFKNSIFKKAEKAYSSLVRGDDTEAAVGYLGEILSDGCESE